MEAKAILRELTYAEGLPREALNLNPAVGLGCPLCDVGWDNRGLRFRRG